MSAVLIGVGLKGMAFITSAFGSVLSELVNKLIENTGLNLPALDVGWQAVASVAYSTNIGMMFIGVGLIFQIIIFWSRLLIFSSLQISGIIILSLYGGPCFIRLRKIC